MKKIFLFIAAMVFISIAAIAQTDSCSCASNFDYLVIKAESNYIAYVQKIKDNPAATKSYQAFKETVRGLAVQSSTTDCIEVLKKYTAYFKDGHLFVFETPSYSEQELKEFKTTVKAYPLTEQGATDYYAKNKKLLDPVEGIWYAEKSAYRLAVIRDPADKTQFFAVVLQSANTQWKPGMVKATFTKVPEGYSVQYVSGNFGHANYEAAIHKDAIMNIGALIYWGKSFPVSHDQLYTDKNNAGLPTVTRINADNILVSIPSFLVERAYMDSLIKAHYNEIIAAKNLLVDIRGNGGGNAVYFPLINIYYTRPYKDSRGLSLSSPNNIKYFKTFAGYQQKKPGDTSVNIYETVVRDMMANPGKIVNGPDWPRNSNNVILPKPQKVCILIDKACASAAESFIIHSKGFSDRITTFGENTHGMVDYTSVSVLPLLCRKQNYYFGYPTSTLHERIPLDGYNAAGIPPDIRIADTVKDKIQFIIDWLDHQ